MDQKSLAGATTRLFVERDCGLVRSKQAAKKKFEYGLEKTRQRIVRLLKAGKPKERRTCSISSRTNSPACVDGAFPRFASRLARLITSFFGILDSPFLILFSAYAPPFGQSADVSLIQLSANRFKGFFAAPQNICDLFFPFGYCVL